VPLGVDAGGDDGRHTHHPASLSHLVEERVEPYVGIGPGVERAVTELSYSGVEILGQL
jgi:hypothetical protein